MSFRMHRYPTGVTGLAAFCDTCGEQITEYGYVVWNHDPDTHEVSEWRVIHAADCDDGRFTSSMALDNEIIYLARSANIDLKRAESNTRLLDSIG